MKRRSAIVKEALREIWKTRNRFLSILAIVAIGTGFFAGVKSSCPDMILSATQYYDSTQLSDLHLLSTFGFNDDDLNAIRQADGIRGFMPSYSVDVMEEMCIRDRVEPPAATTMAVTKGNVPSILHILPLVWESSFSTLRQLTGKRTFFFHCTL